jgi:pimeloyl-ACP methyl ester carboxylesterase
MYPAGEPGISVRYVRLDNGLSIRVVESGPADGPPVLLVHGWGGCVYSFDATIPALASAGFRAAAIDLPGHGLSDKPTDESHYTTAAMAAVISEVADALGFARFTYIGHSMGGALGLRLAQTGSSRIERLVIVSAASLGSAPIIGLVKLLSPRIVNRVTPRLLTRRTITMVLRVAFSTAGRPDERDIDQYWATTQFDEGAWACRALLHRFTFERVPIETLAALRLPVLVVLGGRDRLVLGGSSRARSIPGARVLVVPEGGHLVMQECAGEVNRELVAFLGGGVAATPYRD